MNKVLMRPMFRKVYLEKQKKDLQKDEKEEARQVTNNNMFVGSTTDLQRMLLNKDNVIDAEVKK